MGGPNLYSAQDVNNVTKPCLFACNLQTETVTVTSASYPNKALFPFRKDVCLTLEKLARICSKPFNRRVFEDTLDASTNIMCKQILSANNTERLCDDNDQLNVTTKLVNKKLINFLYNYAKNNIAAVTVFIKDPFYTSIVSDEAIPLVIFLGNAGGLVGFYLGISLVSFFEIFYYFFDFVLVQMNTHFFKGPNSLMVKQ